MTNDILYTALESPLALSQPIIGTSNQILHQKYLLSSASSIHPSPAHLSTLLDLGRLPYFGDLWIDRLSLTPQIAVTVECAQVRCCESTVLIRELPSDPRQAA
jgi:hypothetical protein